MLACPAFWVSRYFWNGPWSSTPSSYGISTGGRRNMLVYGVGVFFEASLLDWATTAPPPAAMTRPPPPRAIAPLSTSRRLRLPRVIELPHTSVRQSAAKL
jgi:hypothetical protein